MAELLALVASVVQVVGAGLKLSETLYQYGESVATADSRIKSIAKEIQLTSFVIEELGTIFRNDETSALLSKNAVRTADATMECSTVFAEIEETLKKTKKTRFGKLLLPFKDKHIELRRSHIDKLKSTLQLLMQVLTHAQQVASHKLDREAEAKQREQIKRLIDIKKKSTEKYEQSLKNIKSSDESTSSEDERDLDQPLVAVSHSETIEQTSVSKIAAAIGSKINAEALATCVKHIPRLLGNIENLQQALSQHQGDDHSDYHQNLIGSYLQSREHLDQVLLGSSKTKHNSIGSGKAATPAGADSVYLLGTGSKVSGTSLSNATTIDGNSIESNPEPPLLQYSTQASRPMMDIDVGSTETNMVSQKDLDLLMLDKTRSGDDGDDILYKPVQQLIKIEIGNGRLYCFPYKSCKSWNTVYKRITEVIDLDGQLQRDVFNGRFRILTEDGDVVLPDKWDELIEPGSSFTLQYQDSVAVDSAFGKPEGLGTNQSWVPSVHTSDRRVFPSSSREDVRHANPAVRAGDVEQLSLSISDMDEIKSKPVERMASMNPRLKGLVGSKRKVFSNTSLQYHHNQGTDNNEDRESQRLKSDKFAPLALSHKGDSEGETLSMPPEESKTGVTHMDSKANTRYRRPPHQRRQKLGWSSEQPSTSGKNDSDEGGIRIFPNATQTKSKSWGMIEYAEKSTQAKAVPNSWSHTAELSNEKSKKDQRDEEAPDSSLPGFKEIFAGLSGESESFSYDLVDSQMRRNSQKYKDMDARRDVNEEYIGQSRFEPGRAAARPEAERNWGLSLMTRNSWKAKEIPDLRIETIARTTLATDAGSPTSIVESSKDYLVGDEVDALLKEWTNVLE